MKIYYTKLGKLCTAFLFFYFSSLSLQAANRYWVATSTGDWHNTANWGTGSGSSGGASIPGSSDIVYFDANGSGSCNLTAAVAVSNFNMNGYAGSLSLDIYPITINGTFTLNGGTIHGGSNTMTINGQMNILNGSLNCSSGLLDLNHSLNMTGGTFNAPSSTMTITGSWTRTGGSFNHNSGTVKIDGSGSYLISETYYNLTFDMVSGSSSIMNLNDTIKVKHDLILNKGTLGSWNPSNNVYVSVEGDLTINSTFYEFSRHINLRFSGSQSVQELSDYSTSKLKCKVEIDKPSGEVKLLTNHQVGYESSHLKLLSGTLNLNDYTFNNTFGSSDNDLIVQGDFIITGSGSLITKKFTMSTGSVTCNGTATIKVIQTFTQTGGTFNSNSSTIDLGTNITQTGGIFNAPSDSLIISGTWNQSGSVFNHNNGLVVFQGTGGTISMNDSIVLYNLTFNMTSGTQQLTAQDDKIIVKNNLDMHTGNIGSFNSLDIYLEIQGNAVIKSTFGTIFPFVRLTFSGSQDQVLDLTGATSTLRGDLLVNKSSGELKLESDVVLQGLSQELRVIEGILFLNGKSITYSGSSDSFIVENGGTLKLIGIESLPSKFDMQSGSNGIYVGRGVNETITIKDFGATDYHNLTIADTHTVQTTFELGAALTLSGTLFLNYGYVNGGSYVLTHNGLTGIEGTYHADLGVVNGPNSEDLGNLGLELSTSSNLGNTDIYLYFKPKVSQNNEGIHRSYLINPSNNTNLDATVRITYNESELNGIAENNLQLFTSFDDSSWLTQPTSRNTTSNQIWHTNDFDSIRWFTIGDVSAPLPVTWLNVTAEKVNNLVRISWATASEYNNQYFTVYKSVNGAPFLPIHYESSIGNHATIKRYSTIDNIPKDKKVYYKIRQTDFDGKYSESIVVSVNGMQRTDAGIHTFPTPASGSLKISFHSDFIERKVKITLINMSGQIVVHETPIVNNRGTVDIQLDQLRNGNYFLVVMDGQSMTSEKISVIHE